MSFKIFYAYKDQDERIEVDQAYDEIQAAELVKDYSNSYGRDFIFWFERSDYDRYAGGSFPKVALSF